MNEQPVTRSEPASAVQLAEFRGEIVAMLTAQGGRLDGHEYRLIAVETNDGKQEERLSSLEHRRAADDGRARAWAAAGTLVGGALGIGATLAAGMLL